MNILREFWKMLQKRPLFGAILIVLSGTIIFYTITPLNLILSLILAIVSVAAVGFSTRYDKW